METQIQSSEQTNKELVYNTRFGDCTVFGLSRLPNAEESPLMLLQCVNDENVSFLVADPQILGLTIAEADRKLALKETKMPESDTQFLVILSLYDHGESYYMTANLKAPVLVDSANRKACQHILANKDYNTQHKV